MKCPYMIIKSALMDISEYVHQGIDITVIEEHIEDILRKHRNAIARPVPGLLTYEIKTTLSDDNQIKFLMDALVTELDILIVSEREKKAKI